MSILDYYRENTDNEREFDIPMTAEEEIEAQNTFNSWKRSNRKIEEDIDRFMRDKVETITAIMELSDRMHVYDGNKVVIEDKKKEDAKVNNTKEEEIRLLKEQNELLKEILLQKMNKNE